MSQSNKCAKCTLNSISSFWSKASPKNSFSLKTTFQNLASELQGYPGVSAFIACSSSVLQKHPDCDKAFWHVCLPNTALNAVWKRKHVYLPPTDFISETFLWYNNFRVPWFLCLYVFPLLQHFLWQRWLFHLLLTPLCVSACDKGRMGRSWRCTSYLQVYTKGQGLL